MRVEMIFCAACCVLTWIALLLLGRLLKSDREDRAKFLDTLQRLNREWLNGWKTRGPLPVDMEDA